MSSDEQQLREELQQLREDYKTLEHNFDIMSEGYQESLLLYDKLEETYHELAETNKELDQAERKQVLEQLFPKAILSDYERFAFPMQQIKRLQRHPWAYKVFWFLERCLFKKEKRQRRKNNVSKVE